MFSIEEERKDKLKISANSINLKNPTIEGPIYGISNNDIVNLGGANNGQQQ